MISFLPSDFTWRVATNGHHWTTARVSDGEADESFLSDFIPVGSAGYRNIRPLAGHSGLFREFAATALDEASIKAFADRYGMLGGQVPIPLAARPGRTGSLMGVGEPLALWEKEITDMRCCVELHEHARKENLEALARHIHWSDGRVRYMSHPDWKPSDGIPVDERLSFSDIVREAANPQLFQSLRYGDVVTPALWYVRSEINSRISEQTSPRLLWDVDSSSLITRILPKNLFGAMWLQFALSVERKSEFRQCSHCGKWFELSPSMARSDKQFCSTACRVKAFRQRKLEAPKEVRQAGEKGSVNTAAADAAEPEKLQNRTPPKKNR